MVHIHLTDAHALALHRFLGDVEQFLRSGSQAGGYVNEKGNITGWLNELAFVPVDYHPAAPVDEWSGDAGCGVQASGMWPSPANSPEVGSRPIQPAPGR